MQRPTLSDVHIRTSQDAHKLFYAVQLGLLPKIEKRLDANERAALRPGDVFVWEEKGPNTDAFNVSMERFTEGKSWTASRVRDDFLMYFETRKGKGRDGAPNARTSENQVVRQGENDLYIKLTYSVFREEPAEDSSSHDIDDKQRKITKSRKWHLNAYFTKLTEGQLRTIDDIQFLRDLVVPDGIFRSARTNKTNKRGESSKTASSSVKRTYAPFPSNPARRLRSADDQGVQPPRPISISREGIPQHASPVAVHSHYHTTSLFPELSFPPAPPLSQPNDRMMIPTDSAARSSPPSLSLHTLVPFPTNASAISASLYTLEPDYEYASASMAQRSEKSLSPSLSDYSMKSRLSAPSPMHMSPALSNTSSLSSSSPSLHDSLQDSLVISSIPPLQDDGSPYKPAPLFVDIDGFRRTNGVQVDLAPLHSLPRTQTYRRSSTDDRALRLLGPGAH
ncbi:cAMP-independent regulatory protein pac2 [Grifola frondosa]|uniref:cAMP-independent regulatory protein pac2 n=1 Tax=Grifola frondosa TaxID=5627 RepID=A0A1C7M1Y5_GRIFR|nr:cAMP-independent regulatory protein pac2 [Grifola frondosa]